MGAVDGGTLGEQRGISRGCGPGNGDKYGYDEHKNTA
jgi:hypothetical protein